MVKKYLSAEKFNILFSLLSLVLMWAVWIIAYYCIDNDYILPSFTETCKELFLCFCRGEFWIAAGWSLLRTFAAFAFSFVFAVACAALSAVCKPFSKIINPIISVMRTLPTLAVILLILIWSNAAVAPIIVTVLVLYPLIYARINVCIAGIDGNLIEMAKVYKISRKQQLFKIYLPLVSPNILSHIGADMSLGLKVVISAEVLSNTFKSMGGLMQNARAFLEMPLLAALTIASVLIGLALDFGFSQFKRFTYKWRGRNARK